MSNKLFSALQTTEAELLTLIPRLSGAYRSNIEALLIVVRAAMNEPTPDTSGAINRVLVDIATERGRQIFVKGWTPEHDDTHTDGELARAGVAFAMLHDYMGVSLTLWPFNEPAKNKGPRCNLIRAAALIVAEIERIDRRTLAEQPPAHMRQEFEAAQQQVRSGCVVRDTIQSEAARVGETFNKDFITDTPDAIRHKYNEALNYALKLDPHEAMEFIGDWVLGDVSNWPAFTGPKP